MTLRLCLLWPVRAKSSSDTNRVRQQIGRKQFCERRLLVQHLDHGFFVYAHEPGVFRGGRDRRPKRLSSAKCEVVKFCC